MSFKKGDRVRLTVAHPNGDGRSGPPLGACGVVVEHTSGGTRPLVKFDGWSGGHHTERACWWVPVDKLARETTTTFKKGDRVEAIKAYDGKKPSGLGTVHAADHCMVEVTWDTWCDGHGSGQRNWNYAPLQAAEYLRIVVSAAKTEELKFHAFKVGDRGLTRGGVSYEVVKCHDKGTMDVKIGDHVEVSHCYTNGRCFSDGREVAGDLMPPTEASKVEAKKFRLGERVVATNKFDGKFPRGVGTIVQIAPFIAVDWDTWNGGSSSTGGSINTRWEYYAYNAHEYLREADTTSYTRAFEIGDRVRCIKYGTNNFGKYGVVIHHPNSGWTVVDFDDGDKEYSYTKAVAADYLRHAFKVGDNVEAIDGAHDGEHGVIVGDEANLAVKFADSVPYTYEHNTRKLRYRTTPPVVEVDMSAIEDRIYAALAGKDAVQGDCAVDFKTREFKPGDRVVYTGGHPHMVMKEWVGWVGTVQSCGGGVTIEFDEHGRRTCFPENVGHIVSPPWIKDPEMSTFKLGDRVVATSSYSGRQPTGLGTIVKDEGHYVVSWDTWREGHDASMGDRTPDGRKRHWNYARSHAENYLRHATPYDDVAAGDCTTTQPTPKENAVNLLSPVKIEERTYITLPGYSPTNIKDMTDEKLLASIQQAENGIEELKKLKHQPQVVVQQIKDLEAGIKAVVNVLDARYRERQGVSSDTAASDPAAG